MTRQLKKINKGILSLLSFIIVSAIVGVVRLGYFLGSEIKNKTSDGNSSEAQGGDSIIPSAMADVPVTGGGATTGGDGGGATTGCGNGGIGTTGGMDIGTDTSGTGSEGSSEGY